jgi:hypothetical protein
MPSNRPSQYNRSSIQRNRTATIARQDEALRLRQSGMAFIDIARQLGFTPNGVPRPQSAAEAVRAAERRQGANLANGAVARVARRQRAVGRPSGRTFGVEVEFFNITPFVAVQALANAGITAVWEGYNHTTRPHWKVVTDASVTSTNTGEGRGLELVSPILLGEAGLAEAALVVKTIRTAGAKVDRTCGLHVHVGADGMTGTDIMRVVDLYTNNQDNINSVVSRGRRDGRWARTWTNYSLDYLRRSLTGVTGRASITNNVGSERYRTVNVTAYARHGTLEFRQHQGTLNGQKLTAWVRLMLSIMDKASSMTETEAVPSFGTMTEFTQFLGVDTTTATYFNRRALQLA